MKNRLFKLKIFSVLILCFVSPHLYNQNYIDSLRIEMFKDCANIIHFYKTENCDKKNDIKDKTKLPDTEKIMVKYHDAIMKNKSQYNAKDINILILDYYNIYGKYWRTEMPNWNFDICDTKLFQLRELASVLGLKLCLEHKNDSPQNIYRRYKELEILELQLIDEKISQKKFNNNFNLPSIEFENIPVFSSFYLQNCYLDQIHEHLINDIAQFQWNNENSDEAYVENSKYYKRQFNYIAKKYSKKYETHLENNFENWKNNVGLENIIFTNKEFYSKVLIKKIVDDLIYNNEYKKFMYNKSFGTELNEDYMEKFLSKVKDRSVVKNLLITIIEKDKNIINKEALKHLINFPSKDVISFFKKLNKKYNYTAEDKKLISAQIDELSSKIKDVKK